jgi:hypothetical protein
VRPAAVPCTVSVNAEGEHPAVDPLVPPVAVVASGWEAEPVGSLRVVSRVPADAVSAAARRGEPGRLVDEGDVARLERCGDAGDADAEVSCVGPTDEAVEADVSGTRSASDPVLDRCRESPSGSSLDSSDSSMR